MSNLARLPYRSAAIVETEPADLPAHADDTCMACGVEFFDTWKLHKGNSASWYCTGKLRWWQRKCRETRPHMHIHCKVCGAEWLTAPFRKAYFVR